MLRRISPTSLPTFYDVYQTVIAILGMLGVNRILFEFSWSRSIGYAVGTVMAYWAGTGLVSLLQRSLKTKTSLD